MACGLIRRGCGQHGPRGWMTATGFDPYSNVRTLIGSAVLRLEWRPRSTLYLVWQQVRDARLPRCSAAGLNQSVNGPDLAGEVHDLFGLNSEKVFMLKVSYWLNPWWDGRVEDRPLPSPRLSSANP